jgi:hypothetical protein
MAAVPLVLLIIFATSQPCQGWNNSLVVATKLKVWCYVLFRKEECSDATCHQVCQNRDNFIAMVPTATERLGSAAAQLNPLV